MLVVEKTLPGIDKMYQRQYYQTDPIVRVVGCEVLGAGLGG